MADKTQRNPDNVPGPYYTDNNCTNCGLCADSAPENFVLGDNCAYVKKQPANAAEKAACDEAKASCPSDGVGDDGE